MRRAIVVALVAVAAWAAPAVSDTYGPPFGANSYTTSIDSVGAVEDADDYVASLVAGENLTVTVTSAKGSALLPALSLVAPDGTVTALAVPDVKETKGGKVVALKKRPIPASGRWTVRVAGKTGTQGGYKIAFAVGPAKDGKLTKQHLGGADPLFRDVVVQGIDGALLDVTVTWPKKQSAVHIGAVKDPSGGENSTGTPPAEKPGVAKLLHRALHAVAGPYTVRLSIDAGEATYSVTTHVVPPARPKSKKAVVLSASEPFLEVRATPVRGDAGLTAHLTGSGFPVSPAPQVLFGGVPGTGVVVATDGKSVDAVVPAGAAGSTVEVAVVQADGQASVRKDDFVYVPLPTITDLTDAASASVAGGSTGGGASLTLVGTGFLTGHVVRFGNAPATGVVVVDSSHLKLVTPTGSVGQASVTVEDEFARTATAPFQYEYKDPPAFAASPYSQAYGPTAGGTTITITGTGFESGDQLKFNGSNLSSTFVSSTTRRFVSPTMAAGGYSVALVDRFGLTATGPNFTVKDPPAFNASPYSPAVGPTAGGVSIAISGSGFESTDQLVFNGSNVSSLFVSSTSIRFSSPTLAAGSYSVALVDRFGQTGTGPNFTIKDPPAFSATPYSPAFANTAGGSVITISGSGFESTDQLAFNGSAIASTFVSSTTRRFTSPAIAAGSYTVSLVDRFGQISTGPNFTVKNPPTLITQPYSPLFANTAGGITVTITGGGFESTDQLKFNGSNLASTFVNASTRTFSSPAIAAGSYAVAIVDRFGQTANGPNFTVKDPPALGSTPYSPVFANTGGGTTVTITGSGFESQDQLVFGGSNLTSTFVNSTTRRFSSPAAAAGSYSLAIVDRLGQTATGPNFTVKDPPAFATNPYSPSFAPTTGGTTVTITGSGFESQDQLVFNGSNLSSTFVNTTTRTFSTPALSAGFYSVSIVDRFGQTTTGPTYELRVVVPVITSVAATGGPHIGNTNIAAGGGATITVTGTGFLTGDTVTLGGTSATIGSLSSTQIVFTAPPGAFGTATLVVSDTSGHTSTSTALSYVGYGDVTATRQPGTTSVDNYLALRGAVGDLDNDGSKDDLVITTNYYGSYAIGTQPVYTRILFGQSGALTDVTYSNFPGVGSNGDKYRAQAVAIGDLDGDSDQDIVIAGSSFYVYVPYPGTSYTLEARAFTNNGSGGFTQSAYSPQRRTTDVTCFDYYGNTYTVWRPGSGGSTATALAIGDLDGDGDAEIVMSTDHYRFGFVYINPSYVAFYPGFYYDPLAGSHLQSSGTYYYAPATRIFDNRGSKGFEDVTFPRLPLCGTLPSFLPALAARDLKLGDIDGDPAASLDIVLTWDNPYATTPYGQFYQDSARICTEVLINNGSGFFTDQTSTWMPAVSSPEFWQGNRVELVDLDADGKKDLVILDASSLGGSSSTSSLRILQNTGSAFSDVTSSALPSLPLSGTADDNLRGNALAVRDVDGDGNLDILVGTTETLFDSSGSQIRSTRLLLGDGSLHFAISNEFLPQTSVDTGETTDLVLGDIAGNPTPSLILLSESVPGVSTNGERLRVFDWK